MSPVDFIRREVIAECLRRGQPEHLAERAAGIAAVRFHENRFAQSATELIEQCAKIFDGQK